MTTVSIVVPTVGRPSLHDLLRRLEGQLPAKAKGVEVIVIDDSAARRGPAAARNEGWRKATGEWVVFLDDDVLPGYTWWHYLQDDLDQPPEVAGVQGQIIVPNGHRTDWSANTQRLSQATWITADMAYRRSALEAVGGFDERFPRAFREDADLAFRVRHRVGPLVVGRRKTVHPVREEDRWISVRSQRGNADDALLRRLYGPDWRRRLCVPQGRRQAHFVTTTALLTMALSRKHRAAAAMVWAATTTEFALTRKRNAPGEPLPSLIATGVLIPPLAVAHWLRGWWRHRYTPRWR